MNRRKGEIFEERFLPHLKPFHGSRDLLMHMKHLGLTLTVATSARASELHDLLRVAKVADLIDASADSSDVSASKPDPDIVQSAVERSKISADGLIMIGDTPYDVEAARRAGVKCIALRCGGWWSDADFAGATAIFDGPAHLLAELDGLFDAKGNLSTRSTAAVPARSPGASR